MRTALGVSVLAALLLAPAGAAAQRVCPRAAGPDAEAGWAAFREGNLTAARRRFDAALTLCPADPYASTGLGYVELREGRDDRARTLFERVARVQPENVDALVGLGLLAWRAGDLPAVRERFLRVREIAPDNPTAREYLARLPAGLGEARPRPPLVVPDTLVYPARTHGDRFEVRTAEGWRPFYIKGVNLGAALPGRHPSEFPDSATYARWIREMVDMHANVVRVYTIHPPAFYNALYDWNTAHPDRPLRLIHGVWAELPPDHDYRDPEWEGAFFAEMHRVVDLIHGRADIEPRPGHASGHYVADVSPWVLAYIIGREWEPFSVMAFDSLRGHEAGFRGRYVRVAGGNAMDAWLGRATEEIVAYETRTYHAQRPVAYTNWPTLDPLHHPTETTVDEEMAIRRARGEHPDVRPREYDNDAVSVDAALVSTTSAFPAGYFASYHAYPYYPDFMVVQRDYLAARSSFGPSNYFGYLKELKAHHEGMPVVISEYGVPASLGIAHLQPRGMHHGGETEAGMAAIDRRLTLELAEAGMAGGALFAWMDEWFKKNWVVVDFELPPERNRLWFNRLDAEQHYGMLAMDARPPFEGATLADRLVGWRAVEPLYRGKGLTLRAAYDAAYLWLLVEKPDRAVGDELLVGFDVIDPRRGDFRWPGRQGPRLPIGVEFVLRDTGRDVRVLVDPPQNPFRLVPVGQGARGMEGRSFPVADAPPGLFRSRVEMRYNLPYYTRANEDGRYDTMRVVVNRRRFARDSTEFLAVGYDRGDLRAGPPPDGLWERSPDQGILELRIPWMLLNFTDPSRHRVLQGPGENTGRAVRGADGRWRLAPGARAWPDSIVGELGTRQVDGIGVAVAYRSAGGSWASWPAAGASSAAVARFTWPGWDAPAYRVRERPVYDTMRTVYAALDPYGERTRTGVAEPPAGQPRKRPTQRPSERPAPGRGAPGRPGAAPPAQHPDSADVAWRSGDQATAERLYRARLARNPHDGVALHRVALIEAWSGRYANALDMLERLRKEAPENLDAQVDHARVRAWSGDVTGALEELDRLLAEHPAHAGALEARALFEAWAGRYEASLSTYGQLLAIAPDNEAARRQQAQVLSWASRFEASRAIYDSLIAKNPDDVEARLGLARVLTFADDLDGAVEAYRAVLARLPDDPRALRGLGRALSWAGRLVEGEEVLRRAVAHDRGVQSLVGLAQNLRWQGRNAAALDFLRRAAAVAPTNGDVKEQLRWVNVALGRWMRPSVVVEDDSDDNRMTTTAVAASWHPSPRLGMRVDAYQRTLSQGALDRQALGMTVSGAYQIEPGWTVSAGVGGSTTDSDRKSSFAAVRMGVTSPGRYPYGGGFLFTTGALDATARLAETGVRMSEIMFTGRWKPAPAWRLNTGLGRAWFRGTRDNTRVSFSMNATRRLKRAWSVGGGVRAFGYDHDLTDGYFDPDFYGIAELTARWLYEPDRWSLLVEAAPGVQRVGRHGSAAGAFRASARIAYRLGPGREISVSGGYSSTGLQSFSTGRSDYRYKALILGGSWVFQ